MLGPANVKFKDLPSHKTSKLALANGLHDQEDEVQERVCCFENILPKDVFKLKHPAERVVSRFLSVTIRNQRITLRKSVLVPELLGCLKGKFELRGRWGDGQADHNELLVCCLCASGHCYCGVLARSPDERCVPVGQ
jgi:hypothetical protein